MQYSSARIASGVEAVGDGFVHTGVGVVGAGEVRAKAQRSPDGMGPIYRRLLARDRDQQKRYGHLHRPRYLLDGVGGWRGGDDSRVESTGRAAAPGVRADVGRHRGHVIKVAGEARLTPAADTPVMHCLTKTERQFTVAFLSEM